MKVVFTGRHMELTDALKSYIEAGLQKLKIHFDRVSTADVILSVEKHRHIAEINIHVNSMRIHSKESSPDMYASVDAVLTKLDKQVRKYKDRINKHQPRVGKENLGYHHQIIESIPENEDSPQNETQQRHRVILREKLTMKPMSVDEAVLQFDLVDDQFLVFSNADTHQVNVLYSRDDGTYGLIEPQF
ncbi:MAG TPA: ribosome-associated translation inhibitor RaiA [Candidatus Hydrogenedentes bacterium]|nr:ribosome-associated translation inhibitor RaiA [Candidatus Hydrogenedentota bacterium]HOV73896.1 ribosome-associated translation inhibitor RaiA [Candidatus Hydrogenedentota bacterium]HPC14882.1 ribosome-associated translation inhibitor RaiA [Candidatus Hydrogenedentota bacterium]HRT18746.1 ribosome-associated translation inhibitor RaiA [Candidatus Hydrogenedentota bacterium]HRT63766.1 ribosome-associated translation inhibitor RaiA [Candidatus Hydrogenedentota bacterium]